MREAEVIPVSVDILQSRLHRRRLSTVWTKADCSLVYSGGIEGIRCQDGHWDHPFASGVDAVREVPGLMSMAMLVSSGVYSQKSLMKLIPK